MNEQHINMVSENKFSVLLESLEKIGKFVLGHPVLPVNDTVYSPEEGGPGLVMEDDDDTGAGEVVGVHHTVILTPVISSVRQTSVQTHCNIRVCYWFVNISMLN